MCSLHFDTGENAESEQSTAGTDGAASPANTGKTVEISEILYPQHPIS